MKDNDQEEISAEELEGRPIDTVLAEQINDKEFSEAFDEVEIEDEDDIDTSAGGEDDSAADDDAEKAGDEEDDDDSQGGDDDAEKKGGESESKGGDSGKEGATDSDLLARAAKFSGDDGGKPGGDKSGEDAKPTEKPVVKETTKEDSGKASISFDDLPPELLDEVLEIDGEKTTMRQFFEEYPEIAKVQMAMQKHLLGDRFNQFEGQFKELQESHRKLQTELSHERFMNEVRKVHKDVDSVLASNEFVSWLKEQPKAVERMAYESNDVGDANSILDAYKKTRAKSTRDKSASQSKTRRAVHSSTMGGSSRSSGGEPDKDDFDAGWDIPIDD